jgi:hypothetical protein
MPGDHPSRPEDVDAGDEQCGDHECTDEEELSQLHTEVEEEKSQWIAFCGRPLSLKALAKLHLEIE